MADLDSKGGQAHSVPEWWLDLYRQIKVKRYTGPVQLDCRDGDVVKITQTQTRTVAQFKSMLCDND